LNKPKSDKPKGKKSLGRGLRSLIPDSEPSTGERISEIKIELIDPNPMQPRVDFNPETLEELKNSIADVGVLSPIIVRKDENNRYCLVVGSRRLAASRLAGLKTIPAIVRDADTIETLQLALIENIQREDLNEMELAYAYKRLKDEFYLTQHQIAQKVGKSRSLIANTLRLLELTQNIQMAVRNGEISSGHARALLALDEEKRDMVLEIIRKKSLSVREVEEMSKKEELSEKAIGKKTSGDGSDVKESGMALDPDTKKVLEIIQEHFRTKVEVRGTKRGEGGKIVIHYYGKEDFNYIFQELLNLCGRRKVEDVLDKMREIEEKLGD